MRTYVARSNSYTDRDLLTNRNAMGIKTTILIQLEQISIFYDVLLVEGTSYIM